MSGVWLVVAAADATVGVDACGFAVGTDERRCGGTIIGVARGGAGHWRLSEHRKDVDVARKDTYTAAGLVEVQCRPRRVFLLQFYDMIFKKFQPRKQGARNRWH